MSVILRCPNCGTTKATSGECEGCHEAEVRYFCTNHTPGRWLGASTCPECGARFGEPAAETPSSAPTARVRTRSAVPAPVIPVRTRSPAPARGPASGSALDTAASRMAPWQKLLLAAVRARYMVPRAARDRYRPPIGRGVRGCLMRLLLVGMLLLLALASAAFLFGRALLQGV